MASSVLVPAGSDERVVVYAAAFVAGYRSANTRRSYATDLRQWLSYCAGCDVDPLRARRPQVEAFARYYELRGCAGGTIQTQAGLFTVAHMDAEVFSGLARHHRAGELEADEVTIMLQRLSSLAATRLPITGQLVQAAWSRRDNIAARDALYVTAAHALGADLVTTDERLGRAAPDTVARLE